jgi:cell division protein FtsW
VSIVRFSLLVLVILVYAMGIVMIFNTSSAEVLDHSLLKSPHEAVIKQVIYGMLAFGMGYAIYCLGYKHILRLSFPLLAFFTFLLVLVLIPGIGIEANGAKRWLGLAGITIQPSEFVKFLIPLYVIDWLSQEKEEQISLQQFARLMGVVSIPILLVFGEPNNGTVAIMVAVLVVTLFLGCVPTRYWAIPMLSMIFLAGIAAVNMPYVSARIHVYLHPEKDLLGRGHQPYQAKVATGSGQFYGKGPGKSLQKLSYLPEAQNDYIAAIYGEEFGFLGILSLLLTYMGIAYSGFYIACKAQDSQGSFLAAVITFLISFQAFLNFAVVSGMLPSTGQNLPFFSQGGTSLIVNVCAISLILSVARKQIKTENIGHIRLGNKGAHHG